MQGHFAFLFLFADFLFKKTFLDKKKNSFRNVNRVSTRLGPIECQP